MDKGEKPEPYPSMDRGGGGNSIETALAMFDQWEGGSYTVLTIDTGRRGDTPMILFLDDDFSICELVAFAFESEGFKVGVAGDGRAGLDFVEREMPDIIIVDMRMPIMDGAEFIREMKARYGDKARVVNPEKPTK